MHFSTSTALLLSSFAITQISAKIPCTPDNDLCSSRHTLPSFRIGTVRPNGIIPDVVPSKARPNKDNPISASKPFKGQEDGLEVLKQRSEFSVLPKSTATGSGEEPKTMHILPVYDNKQGAPSRKFDGTSRRPITHCAGTVEACSGRSPTSLLPNERLMYTRGGEETEKRAVVSAPQGSATPSPFSSTKFRNRLPNVRPNIACAGLPEVCNRLANTKPIFKSTETEKRAVVSAPQGSATPSPFSSTKFRNRRPNFACAGTVEACSGIRPALVNTKPIFKRTEEGMEKRAVVPAPQESAEPSLYRSAKFRNRLPNVRPQVDCAGTVEACSRVNRPNNPTKQTKPTLADTVVFARDIENAE